MKPKKSAGCNTPKTIGEAQKAINAFVNAFNAKLAPKPIVNLLEVKPTDHSATIVMLLDRWPQYGVETIGETELVDEWLESQGIKHCSVMFKWN